MDEESRRRFLDGFWIGNIGREMDKEAKNLKNLNYIVLSAATAEELTRKIAGLGEDWEPVGGVAVSTSIAIHVRGVHVSTREKTVYAQTMKAGRMHWDMSREVAVDTSREVVVDDMVLDGLYPPW